MRVECQIAEQHGVDFATLTIGAHYRYAGSAIVKRKVSHHSYPACELDVLSGYFMEPVIGEKIHELVPVHPVPTPVGAYPGTWHGPIPEPETDNAET